MVAVDNQLVLLGINLDGAIELAVHRIILQHVSHVIHGQQVVDTYNYYVIHVVLLEGRAEHKAANATKSVNTDFNFCHNNKLLKKFVI